MGMRPTGPRWEEIGDANVPAALTALCPALPETLYCPYNLATGSFLFRRLEATEDCGLVAFLRPEDALSYIRAYLLWKGYTKVRQVSLDEAYGLAQNRHAVVNCVIVVPAEFCSPAVHYVR